MAGIAAGTHRLRRLALCFLLRIRGQHAADQSGTSGGRGVLDHGDLEEIPVGPIDHGYAHQLKDKILASAYQNFVQTENATFQSEFEAFVRQQSYWLDDYALFRALKDERGGAAWTEWDNDSGSRERLKSKTEAHPTCRSLPKISALFPRAAFGGRVAARGQLRRCRTFWVWRSNP